MDITPIHYPLTQRIRFLNATDNLLLDFYKCNTLEAFGVIPGNISNYIQCMHGINTFKICYNTKKETLASAFIDIKPESSCTICAVGCKNELSIYSIHETETTEKTDYAFIKLCMLSKKNHLSDLYANNNIIVGAIEPMGISKYVAFFPGYYDFKLKKSGSDETFAELNKCYLKAGLFYSLYVIEKVTNINYNQIILSENSN
ncbi:MAG: DUF4397 domain-containing protein [Clostridia bacterium]|nr:DUF4397 domain-containing protein [Clostridia bacterium]